MVQQSDSDFIVLGKYIDEYLKEKKNIILLHINHELDDIRDFHQIITPYFVRSVFITIPYKIERNPYRKDWGLPDSCAKAGSQHKIKTAAV